MIETIRILGKTYSVSLDEDMSNYGECNYKKQTITYSPRQHDDQLKDTLLHEIIHAVDHAVHLELSEKQVHALAGGLYAVLKDNPELSKWLTEV